MYNAFIINWITQAVSSGYSCAHTICGCVCTCEDMWNDVKEGIFYIHSCRERWAGRESQTLFLGQLQFSLSLRHNIPARARTHERPSYERQQPATLISLSTYSFSSNFGTSGSFMVLCFSSLTEGKKDRLCRVDCYHMQPTDSSIT